MVIYTREEKVLIIPEGEGCGCQGGGQPTQRCEREKREAYESGYTAGLHADCGEAIDEAYNSGYTAGLEACSGSTDCSSAITEAYQSGYTEGYNQGQADCPECSGGTCNLQQKVFVVTDPAMENVFPDAGYDGLSQVMLLTSTLWDSAHTSGYNDGYQSGYTEGYNQGQADCPECSGSTCNIQPIKAVEPTFYDYPVDYQMDVYPDAGYDCLGRVSINKAPLYNQGYVAGYDTGFTNGYQSGYTAGLNDCSGTTPNLQRGDVSLGSDWTGFTWTYPDAGYDGFSDVIVADTGYGQAKYDAGYSDGYDEGYQSGSTDGYTDGFNEGYLSGASDTCGNAVNEAYELGYQSGTTDGFNDGHSSGYTDGFDEGHQVGYTQGYEAGQADCPTCPQGVLYNVELDSGWTGISDILPGELINEIMITDNGYGEAKHNEGYAEGYDDGFNEGHSSGYTDGYADGQAACSAATEEAYESGVTEGQGSIFSVKVRWLSPVTSWNLDNYYYPDLFIVDESGTSHQLNYVYQQSPTLVRYNTGMEDDTPQGWIMFAEFAGYLQDGAKYIQPYQVKFPMLNNNLWNNNIEGLSVEINGEVIHNWRQDDSGLDDWQFGSGAWRFTPLATVVSDTYYDATHKMVTFYIQGQVPNNN